MLSRIRVCTSRPQFLQKFIEMQLRAVNSGLHHTHRNAGRPRGTRDSFCWPPFRLHLGLVALLRLRGWLYQRWLGTRLAGDEMQCGRLLFPRVKGPNIQNVTFYVLVR
jgi:hypothetical protein